jgi:hypothetical protein
MKRSPPPDEGRVSRFTPRRDYSPWVLVVCLLLLGLLSWLVPSFRS